MSLPSASIASVGAAALLWAQVASAENASAPSAHLGGGGGVDVSPGRVIASLVACIIIAVLAVLLIRQKGGRHDLAAIFRRIETRHGRVQVLETRRLSPHADVCLLRHDDREYLLLLQQNNIRILTDGAIKTEPPENAGCD